ncbi:hypothetical protein GCM10028771_15230 [Nocardioides marmoraquaticus]
MRARPGGYLRGMSHEADRERDDRRDHDEHEGGGAVSEVANLGDGTPIDPDQAVGGAPDPEVQEGKQGPNARTGNHEPGN